MKSGGDIRPGALAGLSGCLGLVGLLGAMLADPAWAQAVSPRTDTLFENVRIFDGKNEALSPPSNVLVHDGLIETISAEAIDAAGATVIDGGGRVLMPGLIDAHWHCAFAAVPLQVAMIADPAYIHLVAGKTATETLLRGFTTVRDCGGPVFGLKRAIDEGLLPGPRIFPSGAMISQSGGHGDFRMPYEIPRGVCGCLAHAELVGAARIADGVAEVLRATREQLMLGASQLKLMAGGGVASSYDPLDVTQYTEPELHAAVEAAENWGTYVTVHAYTPRAVQQAIRAGVRCIEHGQLLDEETIEIIAGEGIWWCPQPFLDDEDAPKLTGANRAKFLQMTTGTETAYELIRKHDVRVGWGTDTLFDPLLTLKQGKQLAKMVRWFSPAETLTMVTATNADLLALSGPRNPYPGALGVVEPGALADLLLVDGDPVGDITLLSRPETSLALIMKDGVVVKNAL
jgi:imidazolonepropionase-like amidohydrolase